MNLILIFRTKRRANKLWEKLEVNWKPAKSHSRERLQSSRRRYSTVHERFLCTLIQKDSLNTCRVWDKLLLELDLIEAAGERVCSTVGSHVGANT